MKTEVREFKNKNPIVIETEQQRLDEIEKATGRRLSYLRPYTNDLISPEFAPNIQSDKKIWAANILKQWQDFKDAQAKEDIYSKAHKAAGNDFYMKAGNDLTKVVR